jgi:hypothetical protein
VDPQQQLQTLADQLRKLAEQVTSARSPDVEATRQQLAQLNRTLQDAQSQLASIAPPDVDLNEDPKAALNQAKAETLAKARAIKEKRAKYGARWMIAAREEELAAAPDIDDTRIAYLARTLFATLKLHSRPQARAPVDDREIWEDWDESG